MNSELQEKIKSNLIQVQERIKEAANRSGRDPEQIELVVVTKEKSAIVVKTLLDLGIRDIGESYLNEAMFKIDLLEDYDINWHMIGNIQRGKELRIAQNFQVVHSVSSLETARELNRGAESAGKILPVYLELNVSGESTKHGWPAQKESSWDQLLADTGEVLKMGHLQVLGLMTMAPYSDNPEDARPYFSRMREIKDFINNSIPEAAIVGLSMGMSGDFEVAVEEGATVLRIGSALVGPRG